MHNGVDLLRNKVATGFTEEARSRYCRELTPAGGNHCLQLVRGGPSQEDAYPPIATDPLQTMGTWNLVNLLTFHFIASHASYDD